MTCSHNRIEPVEASDWPLPAWERRYATIYSTQELLTQTDAPLSFSMIVGLLREAQLFRLERLPVVINITTRVANKITVHTVQWHKHESDCIFELSPLGVWQCRIGHVYFENDDPVETEKRHTALLLCCRFLERKGRRSTDACRITTAYWDSGYKIDLFPLYPDGSYSIHYYFLVSPDLRYLAQLPEM